MGKQTFLAFSHYKMCTRHQCSLVCIFLEDVLQQTYLLPL
uniref:Uncharacterized protein n=1 Tax=Rhizophora mucronata TaxID=61149 RepID=A0A2P2ITZ2_RHIMU